MKMWGNINSRKSQFTGLDFAERWAVGEWKNKWDKPTTLNSGQKRKQNHDT